MKISDFTRNGSKGKSLLEELNEYLPRDHRDDLIETRANHLIQSAINLIEEIEGQYSEEEADMLKRRLMNSIKGKDPKKFSRSISKIKEHKDGS